MALFLKAVDVHQLTPGFALRARSGLASPSTRSRS